MRTVNLTNISIKEVHISLDPEPILNVLYSLKDDEGNEYQQKWRLFKGERISAILDRLTILIERAADRVREDEGL